MPNPYTFTHTYFDTIGENQAYILGLLFTDGCHRAKTNNIHLSLQIRDRDVLERIKDELKFEGPLIIRKSRSPAWQDSVVLSFSNKQTSARLLELGLLPAKSLILEYPNWLTATTERHFIRGCVDGDGSIGSTGVLVFVGTKSMCTGIAKAFEKNCGAVAKITRRNKTSNSNTYGLRIGVRSGLAKVLSWLYSDSHLFIERKHKAAMEQLEKQIIREQPRLCSVTDCGRTVYGLGLCNSHYRKERYITKSSPKFAHSAICSLEGCDRTVYARKLCSVHYQRQRGLEKKPVTDNCARRPPARANISSCVNMFA